jgi:putative membrane protein
LKHIILLLKGLATGIAVSVPGADSGTVLVVLGIFDKTVESITLNVKKLFKGLPFLIPVGLGLLAGLLTGAKLLVWLFEEYNVPTQLFFIGVILGSVPFIHRECTKEEKLKTADIIPFAAGLVFMVSAWLFLGGEGERSYDVLTAAAAVGAVLSAFLAGFSMLLPGASGATILKVMGFHTMAMNAISGFDLPVIALFGLGAVAGVLVSAAVLTALLKRFRKVVYCVIFGFITASLPGLFPRGFEFNAEGIAGIITLIVGFALPLLMELTQRRGLKDKN